MKLYFLDPQSRAAINVTRLKRLGYETERIIAEQVKRLNALVVIGNGTPDDKVLGILSYHLNGDKVVGIVKSLEKTGLSVLDQLKTYLSLKIDTIMVLIDQEDMLLNDLFNEASERMRVIGINVSVKEEENRLRVYQCSLFGKEADVIIVVNGLDDVCAEKHTIEDHLIKAAGIEVEESSKNSWNSLSLNERENILRELKGKKRTIKELFPQQVAGCERLKLEN